jgi:hypothetical protein
MVLSCASAGVAMAPEAISATPQSNGILDIASSTNTIRLATGWRETEYKLHY